MSILDVFRRKVTFDALRQAIEQDARAAEKLIKHGDIDVRGKRYMGVFTLLHWYASSSEPNEDERLLWVKWLLDHGANIEARDNSSYTPLMSALSLVSCGSPSQYFLCNPRIGTLLLKRGANINAKDNEGKTILHHHMPRAGGYHMRNIDYVKSFIVMGADIFALDDNGKTPLEYLHHTVSYIVKDLGINGEDYERVKTVMKRCGNAPREW